MPQERECFIQLSGNDSAFHELRERSRKFKRSLHFIMENMQNSTWQCTEAYKARMHSGGGKSNAAIMPAACTSLQTDPCCTLCTVCCHKYSHLYLHNQSVTHSTGVEKQPAPLQRPREAERTPSSSVNSRAHIQTRRLTRIQNETFIPTVRVRAEQKTG